jgi:hypothetical protein
VTGSVRRSADVIAWIDRHPAEAQEQIRWMAGRVREADARITDAIKGDRLTFAVEEDWHHWLCGIQVTSRGVSLLLHRGALLDDPDGLLEGDGPDCRRIGFAAAAARPGAVTRIVREAVTRREDP